MKCVLNRGPGFVPDLVKLDPVDIGDGEYGKQFQLKRRHPYELRDTQIWGGLQCIQLN